MNTEEVERLKAKFYQEYFEKHKEEYRRNLQEFINNQNRYVQRKLEEILR